MKIPKQFAQATTMLFKPELDNCPACGGPLTFRHIAWKKHIIRLNGIIYAVCHAYVCQTCSGPIYRSAQAEALALKYGTFGVDVIVRAGRLRYGEHLTRQETYEALRQAEIPICERHVQNLYEAYLVLLGCDLLRTLEKLEPQIETNGGLLLSIDGIQPDKGNETLFMIREVLTGTTLAAANLVSANTEKLKELIQPVLDTGLPVLGVISDGQRSIRKAIGELLPGKPHQLCHYHYLKDIALPLVNQDRKLKVQVKKSLRGIKAVEDRVDDTEEPAGKVVLGYSNALRSLLLERGDPPLKPPGILVFERLQMVKNSLQRCLERSKDSRLASLLRLASKPDNLQKAYDVLKEQQGWLLNIAHMLDPDNTPGTPSREAREKGEAALREYVDSLIDKFSGTDPRRDAFLKNIRMFTPSFLPGLFTCFEHPLLPRTNNDLERFIRANKGRYRRITGRHSWSSFILREGEFVVFFDGKESEAQQVNRLGQVPDADYRTRHDRWIKRQEPTRLRQRFRKDPANYLNHLEAQWARLHPT